VCVYVYMQTNSLPTTGRLGLQCFETTKYTHTHTSRTHTDKTHTTYIHTHKYTSSNHTQAVLEQMYTQIHLLESEPFDRHPTGTLSQSLKVTLSQSLNSQSRRV